MHGEGAIKANLLASAGGTPRGLDRSRECAAEREEFGG